VALTNRQQSKVLEEANLRVSRTAPEDMARQLHYLASVVLTGLSESQRVTVRDGLQDRGLHVGERRPPLPE
jgi:repressor of nif and glnA expression